MSSIKDGGKQKVFSLDLKEVRVGLNLQFSGSMLVLKNWALLLHVQFWLQGLKTELNLKTSEVWIFWNHSVFYSFSVMIQFAFWPNQLKKPPTKPTDTLSCEHSTASHLVTLMWIDCDLLVINLWFTVVVISHVALGLCTWVTSQYSFQRCHSRSDCSVRDGARFSYWEEMMSSEANYMTAFNLYTYI